ncbi:BACON domain-containing protein [Bacteroides sp. GM023]|uniref:BACON domain-containing protein n=1 Tax=Bacteroides sp. GM023 TaxID=2723058 RepID=UPI00168BE220|nr:BACON domain-containing protein [Bacteroides sp. GM023]MBD3588766.1 BACON domain-containing protein [Bacteroides sp. GM023]
MKKLVNILMLLLCVCIVSCDDDSDNAASGVAITGRDVDVTAAGGTLTVTLSEEGDKVLSDQGWCVASISGKTVTLNVEVNKGLEGRTALITVIKGTESVAFPITQPGNRIPIAETDIVTFDAHGGTQEISVESALALEAFVPANVSWLSARVDKDKLIFTAQQNYTLDNLSTNVKLKSGDLETEITVTQSGIVLIPEKTDIVMYNAGDELTIKIESTLAFTAVSDKTWLTVTKDETSITLKAGDNSGEPARTAVVTLTSETLTTTIDVTQRPPIYSDYIGNWALTGYDNGTAFTYNLSIAQATAGTTYKVTSWGKSVVAVNPEFAIRANFDANSGLIYITSQENIGVFTDADGSEYNIMFYGRIEMGGKVYYVGGSGYICYIGQLQADGSVQWMNGQVDIGQGPMPVVGANYFGEAPDGMYTFKGDDPFMRMPVMTKSTARAMRSMMRTGNSTATRIETSKLVSK